MIGEYSIVLRQTFVSGKAAGEIGFVGTHFRYQFGRLFRLNSFIVTQQVCVVGQSLHRKYWRFIILYSALQFRGLDIVADGGLEGCAVFRRPERLSPINCSRTRRQNEQYAQSGPAAALQRRIGENVAVKHIARQRDGERQYH